MSNKIITLAEFLELKKTILIKKSIVFTNGCFDIIHPGHTDYLAKAKALGDVLIVGVNSDESVIRLKGPARPIQTLEARSLVLSALSSVDYVIPFEEDTPLALIKSIEPNVLVKGGDYTADTIVGAQEVLDTGGEVKVIPFLEGYSTSSIVAKIKQEK